MHDLSGELQKEPWLKLWAGDWPVYTTSHWGCFYIHKMKVDEQPFLDQSLIITKEGRSSGYAPLRSRRTFGTYLANEVKKNPDRVIELCDGLKKHVQIILSTIEEYEEKEITHEEYVQYWKIHQEYYVYHVAVKYVVDYLEPELLEQYLPYFEEARIVCEPVFHRTEDLHTKMATTLAQRIDLPVHLILCSRGDEFEAALFSHTTLPSREELEQRWIAHAFYIDQNQKHFFVGDEALAQERLVAQTGDGNQLKGSKAYGGKVRGVVRVVLDPRNVVEFNNGDILVSGMTRPEFLPLMKKAGAFVTDSGGILSHAAIVARELKKPCVLATEVATKRLKTGDMVEVNADEGTVTIL